MPLSVWVVVTAVGRRTSRSPLTGELATVRVEAELESERVDVGGEVGYAGGETDGVRDDRTVHSAVHLPANTADSNHECIRRSTKK